MVLNKVPNTDDLRLNSLIPPISGNLSAGNIEQTVSQASSANATIDLSNSKYAALSTDSTTDDYVSVGFGARRTTPFGDHNLTPGRRTLFTALVGCDVGGGTWFGADEGIQIGFSNSQTYDDDHCAVFNVAENVARVDVGGIDYDADLSSIYGNLRSNQIFMVSILIDWDAAETEFYIEGMPFVDDPVATIDHHPNEDANHQFLRSPGVHINGVGSNTSQRALVSQMWLWPMV